LTLVEDNTQMRIKVMKILELLSSDEMNCIQMLNADCANRIILRINTPQNEEILFRSIEIIWNLLENGDQYQVADQFNSLVAIG
jgi:cilia- and flagella-associated protein 69